MEPSFKNVALIPARSGSKRVKSKNIKLLNGHPLIAYTISAAVGSGIFSNVIVSTDSEEIAEISRHYGAEVPFMRPGQYAGDFSPDIDWVRYTLERFQNMGRDYDCYSILRPTSPFRQPETIRRAWGQFVNGDGYHSLRAVELCKQHPYKMWVIEENRLDPLLPDPTAKPPWHSRPYQSLPRVYVQNASLEISWTSVVYKYGSISGDVIMPFLTEEIEGFDINDEYDWIIAEYLIANGKACLPAVKQAPYGR